MRNPEELSVVLILGGLDPSGGAGILVDAAAVRAAGAHGAAVLTVNTVQDGTRFATSRAAPALSVAEAMELLLENTRVRAVKTGALGDRAVAETVARLLFRPTAPPLIVDPVMLSSSGGVLLESEAVEIVKNRIIPRAALVTPNLAEAAYLSGMEVSDVDDMRRAARALISMGSRAVLIKGGHLDSDEVVDVYVDDRGAEEVFADPRHPIGDVRGTGCALASTIAGLVARGLDVRVAVARARRVLREAIAGARSIGDVPLVLGLF